MNFTERSRFSKTQISFPSQSGAAFRGMLFTLLLVFIGVTILWYTFGTTVMPGQMGIRQIAMGPKKGFSSEALAPGYHWTVPFYSKVHVLPKTIQILELERDPVTPSTSYSNVSRYQHRPDSEIFPALEVQTTDGAGVFADISVLYRYYSGKTSDHGGPATVLTELGTPQERTRRILDVVTNELKKSLLELSSSEFYHPELREGKISAAEEHIDLRLRDKGIKIEAVLLRRYTYKEERIDQAIFAKNLQDQQEKVNVAKSHLSEAQAELERSSAEWDAKIKTLQVKSENDARVIISEGDLYEAKQNAEGDLLVAKARAEVDRLKATALSSVRGADIYVAKEMAPLLSSLKGGVVTEIDPYDLEQWMERLGTGKGGGQ